MSNEIILLGLRLVSGLVLMAILTALFIALWRDYRSVANTVEFGKRIYGQLTVLREIDGKNLITGEIHPLLPLTSLGRSPTNTVPINDTFASGEHALVAIRNGQWWLEDRQSRNGTTLNGIPVKQPVIITDGDVIGIGSLKFRLELEK